MNRVEEILSRLYQALSVKNDTEFCSKYGIKKNTLSTWKKRESIPYKLIEEISQNENLSIDWVLTGKDRGSAVREIKMGSALPEPVMTQERFEATEHRLIQQAIDHTYPLIRLSVQAAAGAGIEHYEVEESEVLIDRSLFRHPVTPENLRVIQVTGDSMEPTIPDQSHIVIDTTTQTGRIDGIYAINLDGGIMVKRLQFHLDGSIEILSDNPSYAPQHYDPAQTQIPLTILGRKILSIQ